MANIKTAPFGENIAQQLEHQNRLLSMIVEKNLSEVQNWKEIGDIVRKGIAPDVFNIGDQLVTTWKDTVANKEYEVPMDIVHFGDVTLSDGEVVPGMFLQWHYATPFGVQFDQNEAFYYTENGISAGTYHFAMGNAWGNNVANGKVYQFTLANEVPAGGQLQLGLASSEVSGLPDNTPANWRVRSYTSGSVKDPIEVVALTEGNGGTDLGTLSSATKFGTTGLNNMQRSGYGYNRWSQSGIRQYLNSAESSGNWWKSQNVYDRAPNEHWTKNGFMSGFDEDFLAQLKPVKVTTGLNTVTDSAFGTTEDTYDTFFLASKRNENLTEQLANVEGDIWEYWYRATDGVKPVDYKDYAAPRTYAIENHASPQYVRLRSANRGTACNTWSVYSNGYVSHTYAANASRFAPACVIC